MSTARARRIVSVLLAFSAATGLSVTAAAATQQHHDYQAKGHISASAPAQRAQSKALAADQQGLKFVPIAPTRSYDTRTTGKGPLGARSTLHLQYAKGQIPDNVSAAVFNLTTINNAGLGTFVTAWSDEGPRPTAANVNLAPKETRATMVTVPFGTAKDGTRTVGLYNNNSSVDMAIDIAGFYVAPPPQPDEPASYGYQPVAPNRVLDTRTAGPLGPGATTTADLSNAVPQGASAAVVNLTATDATDYTYATIWPDGSTKPKSSSVNTRPGTSTPNLVTVQLSDSRKLNLYNNLGKLNLLVDVVGYYGPSAPNLFYPSDPVRLMDTRDGSGAAKIKGALAAGQTVHVPSVQNPPAAAFALSVTGISPTASTYLTTWATGARPSASNLNLEPGQIATNAAQVGLQDGAFNIYNNAGKTDVAIDAFGAFAPAPAPAQAKNG